MVLATCNYKILVSEVTNFSEKSNILDVSKLGIGKNPNILFLVLEENLHDEVLDIFSLLRIYNLPFCKRLKSIQRRNNVWPNKILVCLFACWAGAWSSSVSNTFEFCHEFASRAIQSFISLIKQRLNHDGVIS